MTVPTVRAWSAIADGSSGSITVAKPTGTVDGDTILVVFMNRAAWFNGSFGDFTGFTNLDMVHYGGTSTQGDVSVWTKTASSEPSSWTLAESNVDVCGIAVSFVGTATVEHYTLHENTTTSTSLTSGSLTPTLADTLLLLFDATVASGTAITSVTTPTGMTAQAQRRFGTTGFLYVSAFYEVLSANSAITKTYSANFTGKNANFILNLKDPATNVTVSAPKGAYTMVGLAPTLYIPQVEPTKGNHTYVGKVPVVQITQDVTVAAPKGGHTYLGRTANTANTATLHQCLSTASLVYSGVTSVDNSAIVSSPVVAGSMTVPVDVGAISSSFTFSYLFTGNNFYGPTRVQDEHITWAVYAHAGDAHEIPGDFGVIYSPNQSYPGPPTPPPASGTVTLSGLAAGNVVHIDFYTSWGGATNGGNHFGASLTEACLDQQIQNVTPVDVAVNAPIATTHTYLGYAPTFGVGKTITPPTATYVYNGLIPTFVINAAHIIPVPTGNPFTYVGLGPVILGTTQTVTVQTLVTNVQYVGLAPTVRPTDPTELTFNFIDESYVGYTALDGTPLPEIVAGALFHGQTKTMRFRIGNTSHFVVDFDLSADGLNQDLVDSVEFSTDNINWSPTLHIPFILGNSVTEMIFMRLSVLAEATIGVGTYLVNVEKTYAQ